MTLVELAVLLLLLGIALFVTAGLVRTVRERARNDLAVRLLCAMDEALGVYMQRYEQPPPGEPNGASRRALAALLAYGPSSVRLDFLPQSLRGGDALPIVDPWGTPLRYVTEQHQDEVMRARVITNGGRPIFDSAGPDRQFSSEERRPEGSDIWGEECLLEP